MFARVGASRVFLVIASLAVELHAQPLISETGCANCHTSLQAAYPSSLRERTPELSGAGLRYHPAWLFEYLRDPVKVRRHLGRARMPAFHLQPDEALALVRFLATQTNVTGAWPAIPPAAGSPSGTVASAAQFQTTLASGLLCLNCHTVGGRGGALGVELNDISFRLRPEWVRRYLVAPAMFGVPHSVMPAQFYVLTNGQFEPLVSDPAGKIDVIANYLFSLNAERRQLLEERYAQAQRAHPEVTPEQGRMIFTALNCAACHRHNSIAPRSHAAPDMTPTATRLMPTWTEAYLRAPYPVRPFGFHPGDGSRMPDFRFTKAEVNEVMAALFSQQPQPMPPVRTLSAFATRKARLLLEEKLSCLGCHSLGQKGGRIAPDLGHVHNRLHPDYAAALIRDPRRSNPHTIMPKSPLTPEVLDLVRDYLLQKAPGQRAQPTETARAATYPSLLEHSAVRFEDRGSVRGSYLRHCAPCHGEKGAGDGFNARFLPRKPTAHSDAATMALRPDATLFDGIHAGAGILNKSPRMPAWGETFSPGEISALVRYLRELCQCQGPEWSRDGKSP